VYAATVLTIHMVQPFLMKDIAGNRVSMWSGCDLQYVSAILLDIEQYLIGTERS
jgi:hypothetical protein